MIEWNYTASHLRATLIGGISRLSAHAYSLGYFRVSLIGTIRSYNKIHCDKRIDFLGGINSASSILFIPSWGNQRFLGLVPAEVTVEWSITIRIPDHLRMIYTSRPWRRPCSHLIVQSQPPSLRRTYLLPGAQPITHATQNQAEDDNSC